MKKNIIPATIIVILLLSLLIYQVFLKKEKPAFSLATVSRGKISQEISETGQVHPIFYFSASVTPGLILFGLFFSFFVGCLAGFFPAKMAAKLKPVEALRRYE